MTTASRTVSVVTLVGFAALGWAAGCGSGSSGFPEDGDGGSGSGSGGPVFTSPNADGSTSSVPCPTGMQCNVSCSGGGTTSVSGTVYDPAGKNPLYNIAVYVPAAPLVALPKGVPTGSDACSCAALFKSGNVVTTATAIDGTFTLTDVPVGAKVPLVLQVGKWRKLYYLDVKACQNNAQPDKSLKLPATVAAGDTNDSMPDIAVSTGSADSLECLMHRIGLPATEYVAGSGTGGHVHIYSGGNAGTGGLFGGFLGGGGTGRPETPPMPNAPASYQNLWSTQAQLMPYDIVLLSCEGGETYNANPQALEAYLNAGGRAFGSHYHYAWFSGPIGSGQSYTAPTDWGTNLATWTANGNGGGNMIAGVIDQTLNGSTAAFPKGQALDKWLGIVGALGQSGVPAADLSIFQPRYNAQVTAANTPSQPWITSPGSNPGTMYFSFDTPINPPVVNEKKQYCGRAVFSDLHVGGDTTYGKDSAPPPGGCASVELSPQEKALEFMLFDLSACVIPDTQPPPPTGFPPQ